MLYTAHRAGVSADRDGGQPVRMRAELVPELQRFERNPIRHAGRQFCSNVLGNSGRNSFYGPKLTDVDFSIFKNTKIPRISEAFNLQLRAEFFNILNHTNFLSPGFLNTFGQNNSAVRLRRQCAAHSVEPDLDHSRQIQLGAKVIF